MGGVENCKSESIFIQVNGGVETPLYLMGAFAVIVPSSLIFFLNAAVRVNSNKNGEDRRELTVVHFSVIDFVLLEIGIYPRFNYNRTSTISSCFA